MTETAPPDAQHRLLATYLERRAELVRFFTSRLRSAASAEDLVQDIYFRLTKLEGDVEVSSDIAYLYRIGSNLMLDRIRGEKRLDRRQTEWRDQAHIVVQGEAVAEAPLQDRELESRQRLQQVVAIVETLPPQTALAFRLHKFKGMTHPEVARAMGISQSGVEKHISAALKQLLLRLP